MRVPLQPPPGIFSDDTTFSKQGQWADGNNIRFWQGKPQTIGGSQLALSTSLTGVCRNVLAWTQNDGSLIIAFGTHSALQVYFAGVLSTITPAGLGTGTIDSSGSAPGYGSGAYGEGLYSTPDSIYYPRTWSLQTWGQTLLANPRGLGLYQWSNNPAVVAVVVTNAPTQITAILVTPQRQVLALGTKEEVSGDFNPLCIRGCDLEDLTDWTTAPDNSAFEHILEGGGGGHIVTARMVGPYVAVWTDTGLYLGEFLGNPDETYRFDPVASNCGIVGPNAVHVVGQVAYWVSPDGQFRRWTPGAQPEIIPCPIRTDFAENLDKVQAAKIVAAGVSSFNEVWWHYPDTRDGMENSRYVALSLQEGTWFRGQLPRTAAVDAGVAPYPIATTYAGLVYYQEVVGGSVTYSLTTADQYIRDASIAYQVQRYIPDFEEQDGTGYLQLTVRRYPQSDAITKGPYTLAEGATKVDFRASGSIVSMRLSGTGCIRLGKPEIEAIPLGQR